jgi:hypothetical protein
VATVNDVLQTGASTRKTPNLRPKKVPNHQKATATRALRDKEECRRSERGNEEERKA